MIYDGALKDDVTNKFAALLKQEGTLSNTNLLSCICSSYVSYMYPHIDLTLFSLCSWSIPVVIE